MPSVAEILKWRDRWTKTPVTVRNGLIEDAIQWIESMKTKCKPDELPVLLMIQSELQTRMNDIQISQQWFVTFAQTYGRQSYFDAFVRKVM